MFGVSSFSFSSKLTMHRIQFVSLSWLSIQIRSQILDHQAIDNSNVNFIRIIIIFPFLFHGFIDLRSQKSIFRFGFRLCVVVCIDMPLALLFCVWMYECKEGMKNGDSVNVNIRQWKTVIGMRGWWLYRWFHPITFTFYHQNSCKKRHLRVHILRAFTEGVNDLLLHLHFKLHNDT